MPLFGQKMGFRLRMNEIKSGIPCSGIACCVYRLNHLAKLLQKSKASQKNQHIASHVATIFCNHLAKLSQNIKASQKNQHILLHIASHVAIIFCNHLAKLLQKIVASERNQRITCCYYLHLAKLLQKIV